MNHFPIQRVLFNGPQGGGFVQKVYKPENITIDQLRQENEFLKRQLSDLMRTQPKQNKGGNHPIFSQTRPILAGQLDVEETFKRKLSKIKSKKSVRKSVDQYNQTMPCSPQKFIKTEQQPLRYITNLHFQDSPLKLMVIEQDEKGRFFRNKEKENNQATVRNTTVQKNSSNRKSQKIQHEIRYEPFSPRSEFRQELNQQKNHKRVESNLERQIQNEDITQRMLPRKTQTAFRPSSLQISKEKESSRVIPPSNKTSKIPFVPISPQRDPPIIEKQALKVENKEMAKPSLCSPRGNIYIEQVSVYNPLLDPQEPPSDHSIPEDSMVSIAKGLKQKKTARKLRYDIYLSDDLQNN